MKNFPNAGRRSFVKNGSLLLLGSGAPLAPLLQGHAADGDPEISAKRLLRAGLITDLAEEARSAEGPPASLGPIQALTTAQLGGRTAAAAIVSESPLAISCVRGVPSFASPNSFPLIVIPT